MTDLVPVLLFVDTVSLLLGDTARANRQRNHTRFDCAYANSACERRGRSNRNTAAGTLIGALIGGALGANIASEKVETEGAVLGAVVGGALGATIANSGSDNGRYVAQCDAGGYYFTYDQTYPYREDTSMRGRRSGRYDGTYYSRQRCRLAVAPADIGGRSDYSTCGSAPIATTVTA